MNITYSHFFFWLWARLFCLIQIFPNRVLQLNHMLLPAWRVNLQTGCHGTSFWKHWESSIAKWVGSSKKYTRGFFFPSWTMLWYSSSKRDFLNKLKIIALSLFKINPYSLQSLKLPLTEMRSTGSTRTTLSKDMICLVKKPELVWASLKQQTKYFLTLEKMKRVQHRFLGYRGQGFWQDLSMLCSSLWVCICPGSMGNTSLPSFSGRTLP